MPIWVLIPVAVIVWLALAIVTARFCGFNDRTLRDEFDGR